MPKRLRLETSSRYIKTPLFSEPKDRNDPGKGNNVFFGTWVAPNITSDPATDQNYVVTDKDIGRLDLISFDFYGTPNLWWVIAHVNNIIDPIVDMETGTSLAIPDQARIFSAQLE